MWALSDELKRLIDQIKLLYNLKRSDEITITFAISKEDVGEINIIDFTGKTKLYATSWLEKYGFKVEIKEDYSNEYAEDLVIEQDAKDEVKKTKK